MKVAISGSHGFIAGAFLKRLEELGHIVVSITRDQLYDLNLLQTFFINEKPDWIIHTAAYGNMGHSGGQIEPDKILLANIASTFNMLEASLSIPYTAFLNFGSSSEYGKKEQAMSETDLPETETFYGATKVGSTYIARAFAKTYNKPIVNIRPFSVYGEGEADFRFIPTVIRNILADSVINLEEKATHDWIYIRDFINACILIANKAKDLQGQWINIGTGKSFSNKLIVEMIEIVLGKKLKYNKVLGIRPDDSLLWQADINKLSDLGFKHSYDLTDGLSNTIEFYKKKYEKA